MTSRIYLVRHGRSAHTAAGWLDAAGLQCWFAAYDAAEIAHGDTPPAALSALAQSALAQSAGIMVAR